MIEILLAFLLFTISIELILRLILSIRDKSFFKKGLIKSLFKPYVSDWEIYLNFGNIKKSDVSEKFRFKEACSYMGIEVEKFIEIAAKASNRKPNEIKEIYTGKDAFENLSYQPFVGLFNSPNQKLYCAEINDIGAQGNVKQMEKKQNVKRVMLVGGSTAFGSGATSSKNNITSMLIEYLNSKKHQPANAKIKWEVVNLSFIASQSSSELNLINMYASLYSPDYIIQLSGFNDLHFYLNSEQLFTYTFSNEIKGFLYSSSLTKILDYLCRYFVIAKIIRKIIRKTVVNNEDNIDIEDNSGKNHIYTIY